MKKILLLAGIVCLFCSCSKPDTDTSSFRSFVCNSIRVTKMPMRDGSSRWDVNSDADLFFRIYNTESSSKIYECSNYVQNVSSLPITKKLSTAVSFYKESSYKIEFWDYDDLSSSDFIAAISFSGSQLFSNGVVTSVRLKNYTETIIIELLGYMD